MISIVIFLLELGVLQKICERQPPGFRWTATLTVLAMLFIPALLFAAKIAVASSGVDGGQIDMREHIADAAVQSVLAILATPFFVFYFRRRARKSRST